MSCVQEKEVTENGTRRKSLRSDILRNDVYREYRHSCAAPIRKRQKLNEYHSVINGCRRDKFSDSSSNISSISSDASNDSVFHRSHVRRKVSLARDDVVDEETFGVRKRSIKNNETSKSSKSDKQESKSVNNISNRIAKNQRHNFESLRQTAEESQKIKEIITTRTTEKNEKILNSLKLFGVKNNNRDTKHSLNTDTQTYQNKQVGSRGISKSCEKEEPKLDLAQEKALEKLKILLKGPQKSPHSEGRKERQFAAMPAVNVFKRKLTRKKNKGKYVAKFRRYAKFFLILIRLWKFHAERVNDVIRSFSSLKIMTDDNDDEGFENKSNILFDKRYYRADTQTRISRATKRILQKKPSERTEKEIYKVQVALRSYESIAEYPIQIQNKIASKAWYESFSSKRVITREGHVPMCFYFILSGSAIVSAMDMDRNTRKTLTILTRGDCFGENAIVNKSRRVTTVISKDKLEMIVIGDTDYADIFMSGGLQDPHDPFLKSVRFLDGWPLEILPKFPNKALSTSFKRASVLVQDSRHSEWLYIIKSGSINVLKQLEHVVPDIYKKQRRTRSSPPLSDGTLHASEIQSNLQRHLAVVNERDNYRLRHNALPQINVETTDEYEELKNNMFRNNVPKRRKLDGTSTSTRPSSNSSNLDLDEDTEYHKTKRRKSVTFSPKKMNKYDGMLNTKGPFLATLHESRRSSSDKALLPPITSEGAVLESNSNIQDDKDTLPNVNFGRKMSLVRDKESTFVTVQVLTKGSVFGLEDLVYDKQPGFSLVSNGAECVMINKRFYMEHAGDSLLTKMREEVYPFPTDDDLQNSLTKQVNWNAYRLETVRDVVRQSRLRKLNIIDAKTRLDAPLQAK